jgi:Phytanoyl-CoA dioxygenase (PhyH)
MDGTARIDAVNQFQHLLSGVPLVESPFLNEALAQLELDEPTKAIALQLHHQGWAIIDFPDPEIDLLAERIKKTLHSRYDWDSWRAKGWRDNDELRIRDAYKFNADVQRIAANPQILMLLSTLYGRPAWPFQTLNFPVGTQQDFHPDSVHFSSVPERFGCAVWVALEDIGPNQGPLMYYSGSHKWPIYVNEHIGRCRAWDPGPPSAKPFEGLWEALVRVNAAEANQFHAKKGQTFIWTANLLHAGSRQTDPNLTRWSQETHYYFEGCSYYSPMESDPFYGRIAFQSLRNIANGEPMPNMYCGHRVPSWFVWWMTSRTIWERRLWNKLRRGFATRGDR